MALQRAVKFELIARNPADAVDAPRFEKKKMVVLDEAQVATLLNGAQGTSLYVPTLLAATTGMRRGEILALRWSALDLERGTVAVVQSLEQVIGGLNFKEPKTERGKRSITLPSVTIEALRQHKARQARQRLQLGLGRDDNGLVCARYDGEPRSPKSLTWQFKGLVAKLDIPRITFHGLRHSHATQLLRAGIHPKVAQERLGHSTIAMTMDLYSHVTESMQEDAAALVDAALRAAIGKQKSNQN
jgi:integrase